MKNVLIIHGAYGHPEENWIPWLVGELEAQGFDVSVPAFPTPENQNLSSWLEVIDSSGFFLEKSQSLLGTVLAQRSSYR